jgi:hypothetical protein
MNWAKYREHRTLPDAMVYFTSCQIATYHHLVGLKRSPKGEVKRQRSICEKMIVACEQYGVDAEAVTYLKKQMGDACVGNPGPND